MYILCSKFESLSYLKFHTQIQLVDKQAQKAGDKLIC